MSVHAGGVCLAAPAFARVRLLQQSSRPELQKIREFLRLGLPIGIAIFFEVSVFCVVAILLSPLGELQVAGHLEDYTDSFRKCRPVLGKKMG